MGVVKKLIVDKETDLKSFLSEKLNISKNKAKDIIDNSNVLVNNKRVWIATYKLKKGDVVEASLLNSFTNLTFNIKDNILYEDNFIIAVQKPPFLESNKSKGSVEYLLRQYKKDFNIEAIHRLDKETSGVLLFAKNRKVFYKFKDLWQEKKVKKIYLAISYGSSNFKKKIVNIPIDKKYAKSEVITLDKIKDYSLFKVNIKTGRKHQIRIHLSKLGYPIVGDKLYGLKRIEDEKVKSINRHMLHAYKIEFIHPFLNKKILLKAPVYTDFKRLLNVLKLKLNV